MYEITKGYKQGRAVMFYDLLDASEQTTLQKVKKDKVVEMCNNGNVGNAKIQMWEGKPIVRVRGNIPLVKLDDSGNEQGSIQKTVRSRQGNGAVHREQSVQNEQSVQSGQAPRVAKDAPENYISVADKAVVVGKIRTGRPRIKEQQAYAGYDMQNVYDQRKLNSSVTYDGLNTLGDLFDRIAKECRVRERDTYKKNFGKKIDISKKISGLQRSYVLTVQSEMITYLVNMAQLELSEVYLKYKVEFA